jgi:hypothetical protein
VRPNLVIALLVLRRLLRLRRRTPPPSRAPPVSATLSPNLPSPSTPGANRPHQELGPAELNLLNLFPRLEEHRSAVPAWRPSRRPPELRRRPDSGRLSMPLPSVSIPTRSHPSPLHPAPSTRAPRPSNRRRRQRPVASPSAGLRKKKACHFASKPLENSVMFLLFFCVLHLLQIKP